MTDRKFFIGFYGCSVADRIVCVAPPRGRGGEKPHHTESWKITCPACGETHVVKPYWRRATEHERRTKPELVLPPREAPQGTASHSYRIYGTGRARAEARR